VESMSSTTRSGESMASPLPISSRLTRAKVPKFPLFDQHLGLEGLQPRTQRRATLPDLLRADQPEGRILAQALGIVQFFVARQPAVDGLPKPDGGVLHHCAGFRKVLHN
jgi:hypothetical protein